MLALMLATSLPAHPPALTYGAQGPLFVGEGVVARRRANIGRLREAQERQLAMAEAVEEL